jgi:hypothetical protein
VVSLQLKEPEGHTLAACECLLIVTHLCRSVSLNSSGVTSRRETKAFIAWHKVNCDVDLSGIVARGLYLGYPTHQAGLENGVAKLAS